MATHCATSTLDLAHWSNLHSELGEEVNDEKSDNSGYCVSPSDRRILECPSAGIARAEHGDTERAILLDEHSAHAVAKCRADRAAVTRPGSVRICRVQGKAGDRSRQRVVVRRLDDWRRSELAPEPDAVSLPRTAAPVAANRPASMPRTAPPVAADRPASISRPGALLPAQWLAAAPLPRSEALVVVQRPISDARLRRPALRLAPNAGSAVQGC